MIAALHLIVCSTWKEFVMQQALLKYNSWQWHMNQEKSGSIPCQSQKMTQ